MERLGSDEVLNIKDIEISVVKGDILSRSVVQGDGESVVSAIPCGPDLRINNRISTGKALIQRSMISDIFRSQPLEFMGQIFYGGTPNMSSFNLRKYDDNPPGNSKIVINKGEFEVDAQSPDGVMLLVTSKFNEDFDYQVTEETIRDGVRLGLKNLNEVNGNVPPLGRSLGFDCVAFPLLGTYAGGMNIEKSLRLILEGINRYTNEIEASANTIRKVRIVTYSEDQKVIANIIRDLTGLQRPTEKKKNLFQYLPGISPKRILQLFAKRK